MKNRLGGQSLTANKAFDPLNCNYPARQMKNQNKMALAIYLGIMEYLGNRKNPLVYTPGSAGNKIVRNN